MFSIVPAAVANIQYLFRMLFHAKMTYLENLINQQAESNRQSDSTDDTTTAAPPEDDSETKLDNKQESEGITDEEAAIQSGN